MRRTFRAFVLCIAGFTFAGMALAQDRAPGNPDEGRAIVVQCRTWHGLNKFPKSPLPHIGGEPESYLSTQRQAFRDGRHEHETMTIVARGLSDDSYRGRNEYLHRQSAERAPAIPRIE